MFISVLDLFKVGIGPSSSHTIGPMLAANRFRAIAEACVSSAPPTTAFKLRCTLKGSLAYSGIGHATDKAIILGLHGYSPSLLPTDIDALLKRLDALTHVELGTERRFIAFDSDSCLHFDRGPALIEHPNGMIFQLEKDGQVVEEETYFSIGGGFVLSQQELLGEDPDAIMNPTPYPFESAKEMLVMAEKSGLSIAEMKRANELEQLEEGALDEALDRIWEVMANCVAAGLEHSGKLPGGLDVVRRAKTLHSKISILEDEATLNDWLCAYAMAVNEENAAGHQVVTAPTNGAAGVIPAIIYYRVIHKALSQEGIRDFLLTAAAIGGIIKHRSSISGAEVGCQGEVGSASAMAAAGLCAVLGGTAQQIENAAEIALEHHLGMTCDPVGGLVQIPCIERNGFGAIKAYTSATLAMHGSGEHIMPLDNCIAAMKQTGKEMLDKYKETSQGGLAVNFVDC